MCKRTRWGAWLVLLLLLPSVSRADVLSLHDGSKVEGQVIKYAGEYRVKLADGTTRIIPELQVMSITRSPVNLSGTAFASTRARAEGVDQAIAAVQLWERFLEDFPNAPERATAQTELERWEKMHADRAERINGRWVGGDERRKILAEVNKLCTEARSQLGNQMLQAIDKYDRAVRLYPNCFEAHFALGFCYLQLASAGAATGTGNSADLDRAVKSLEAAVRLQPDSAAAQSNLAIGYSFQRRFDLSIFAAYKAVMIQDNKEIVENLISALVRAPTALKENNSRVRKIMPDSVMLARKYAIPPGGTGQFHYIPPDRGLETARLDGRPGVVGNGSGFLVSADGYLITNRHVVEGKNRIFRIRLDDETRTEKPAEVVAIDEDADIALLKIKSDKPLPYLKLSEQQLPNPGAKCMVLGFPIASELNFSLQTTSGEISGVDPADPYQVTLVASTTHGNSGGPIVDGDGNVIGILSAGTTAFNATYLRAVSSGQVRKFVDRVRDKHTLLIDWAKPANTPFDPVKLAADARKATVIVLIYRGDGKEGD